METDHTYFVGDSQAWVHNGCSTLVNALKDFQGTYYNFGGNNILLDKKGIKHILERHHPNYFVGPETDLQTYLSSKLSVDDVVDIVGDILKQNRGVLVQGYKNGQLPPTIVNGVTYRLGLSKGRVGQLYPLP